MCYFEQTQYLGCGHNVELVTEKCELGEKYRTSMHDKIINALHTDDGQCGKCNPPPAYVDQTNGPTSGLSASELSTIIPIPDLPDVPYTNPSTTSDSPNAASEVRYPLVDLTEASNSTEKRPHPERRDSIGEDLMDLN